MKGVFSDEICCIRILLGCGQTTRFFKSVRELRLYIIRFWNIWFVFILIRSVSFVVT